MKSNVLTFLQHHKWLTNLWSDFELRLIGNKLPEKIEKPIFVCGLARSGSTILTHVLNKHSETASLLYKDLPFLEAPFLWNKINALYYGSQELQQRAHRDSIHIDPNSPDAFEEIIWKKYIANYEDSGFCTVLETGYENPRLLQGLQNLYKKILYIRGGSRYLAKGNYNLLRIHWILRNFPDAKIILSFRNPFEHAQSLTRVHKLFLENPSSFNTEISLLGHHEFGLHRKPINLQKDHTEKTRKHWEDKEDYFGYLLQWIDVYSFAKKHFSNIENILWVNHDSLHEHKEKMVNQIFDHCEIDLNPEVRSQAVDLIREPQNSYEKKASPYDPEAENLYRSLENATALPA